MLVRIRIPSILGDLWLILMLLGNAVAGQVATPTSLALVDSSPAFRSTIANRPDLTFHNEGNRAVQWFQSKWPPTVESNGWRVYLPLVARPPVHQTGVPIGINAGGDNITLANGQRFLADQAYTPSSGLGYLDGHVVTSDWDWEPIDGTNDDDIYRTGRAGMTAYRFDVPNDNYIVHIKLAEIRHHGPGWRVFDLTIEDVRVLRSLDIHEQVQHDYALDFRFPAKVSDGSLNVGFVASIGEPIVSAIWIDRQQKDTTAPRAPGQVTAIGGYGEIILDWPDASELDLSGYQVFRANQGSTSFALISLPAVPLSRFRDRALTANTTYCYRVAAVDVNGNSSEPSPLACATPRGSDSATLPLYQLQITERDLRELNAVVYENRFVPGILTVQGTQYDVEVRYRGNMSRYCNKKSWKFRFLDASPFTSRDVLLLNGECHDPTLIKEKLTYDLMREAGIQTGQASFALLELNGEFIGVYTDVENPDRYFLARTGRNADGNLYKCDDGLDREPNCDNEIYESRDNTDLYDFAALVNNTPDQEFAWAIAQALDVRGFLDYLAVKSVVGDPDSTYSYLLYHDLRSNRWEVLPWDNNAGFHPWTTTLPPDYGSLEHPDYLMRHNTLITRVLAVPQYRAYFAQRLLELTNTLFASANMNTHIGAAVTAIWEDVECDLWKLHREDNDAVRADMGLLKSFVRSRIAYLQGILPAFAPSSETYVRLNEVMTRNATTLVDPADGRAEPWLEIHNAGLRPFELGGKFLTNDLGARTRFRIPTGTTVPPLGYVIFWLDSEPAQGALHANFTLPATGGTIGLVDADGRIVIDAVTFAGQPVDVSWARFPDGTGQWLSFRTPSPNRSNLLMSPAISNVRHRPAYPQSEDRVQVTATAGDEDGAIAEVRVYFRGDHQFTSEPMLDDGLHGDDRAHDQIYGASLPTYALNTLVQYYVVATDNHGRSTRAPAAAPTLTYSYRVGYRPAAVAINELMAANDATIEDPDEPGEFPDWIELYNGSSEPVDLGGFFLTDELDNPRRFRIPSSVTIPPKDFLVFWADDDPQQGPMHANFKLSADGEAVGLYAPDGVTVVDSVVFDAQQRDVSWGRCPDGINRWRNQFNPSPGGSNACTELFLPLVMRP